MRPHDSESGSCGQGQRIRSRTESQRELLSHNAARSSVARPTLLIHDKVALQGHRPHSRRLRIRYHRLFLHQLLTAGIIDR